MSQIQKYGLSVKYKTILLTSKRQCKTINTKKNKVKANLYDKLTPIWKYRL